MAVETEEERTRSFDWMSFMTPVKDILVAVVSQPITLSSKPQLLHFFLSRFCQFTAFCWHYQIVISVSVYPGRSSESNSIWHFFVYSQSTHKMIIDMSDFDFLYDSDRHSPTLSCIGSRPSDHYFRSVCLSVCLSVCCLCRVFLSRLWSDFDQTWTHVICLGLVVSPRI